MSWIKTVFPIAAIFSFRMLGLFMLIPVFTMYANDLQGSTPALIGIALGVYGLTQGLLQIPFGLLSDHWGRKPLLTIGLILFAFGSLLGALTHSMTGMIIARAIQGTGAIGSVLMALLADLTTDKERTKAMAVIGMTIGISFGLSMIISPSLTHHFGLSGIFYLSVGLASLGLVLVYRVIPSPQKESFHADTETKMSLIKTVLRNANLQRFNASIFFQHCLFTSTFYTLPILLNSQITQGHLSQSTYFYLPIMLASFCLMIPIIIIGEKKHIVTPLFLGAVSVTALSQFLLIFNYTHWIPLCILMFIYMLAFNYLEANLPALISKTVKQTMKGTAMGVYSSAQFLGIFTGGLFAGMVFTYAGSCGIFCLNTCLAIIWLLIARHISLERKSL